MDVVVSSGTAVPHWQKWNYESQFLLALRNNNVSTVTHLLKNAILESNQEFFIHGSRYSALFLAIEGGYLDMVKVLHHWGCNLNEISACRRMTPLHAAVEFGRTNIVKYLLDQNVKVDVGTTYGETPLFKACLMNSTEMIKLLLRKTLNNWQMDACLMSCCERRNLEAIKCLLAHGTDVNLIDEDGNTPIFYVLHNKWFKDVDLEILEVLLKAGANVNFVNSLGCTILSTAASEWDIFLDSVKFLVFIKLARLLLKYGFNIQKHGYDVIRSLMDMIKYSQYPTMKSRFLKTAEFLYRSGCSLSESRSEDPFKSILYIASYHEFYEMINMMFRYGLNHRQEHWLKKDSRYFQILPTEVQKCLLNWTFSFPTLQHLCRKNIRNSLGYRADELVPQLSDVPEILKEYLKFC